MRVWTGGNIRKGWSLKAPDTTLADNTLQGVAAVMGNIDSQGDVIFPGAFGPALDEFRRSGFVAFGHEWDEVPIAMPTVTEERGRQLYAECVFHSTGAAQDVRTVCVERLGRGLSVGLSVGFFCDRDGCMWFENGLKLLEFARTNGYDLSLFDAAAIGAYSDYLRAITKVERLVEYSVVPIPANPQAIAMSAKSGGLVPFSTVRELEAVLRDAGFSKSLAAQSIHNLTANLRDAGAGEVPPTEPPGEEQGETAPTPEAPPNEIPADTSALSLTLSARALAARARLVGLKT